MSEPKILLAALVYGIIGFVVGRVWKRAYERRDDRVLSNMFLAAGVFWPFFMVFLPFAIILYNLVIFVIAPPFRWLGRKLDSAVDRVVPEKTKEQRSGADRA